MMKHDMIHPDLFPFAWMLSLEIFQDSPRYLGGGVPNGV